MKFKERSFVLVAICILMYFATEDVLEDFSKGDSASQIGLDLFVIASIAGVLVYIYVLEPLQTRRKNKLLAERNAAQGADLARLSQIAEKQLHGLGVYIKAQFDDWGLTLAEQEVALLLLKGLSMKEISQTRSVSERTARQQAGHVYDKAGLAGRAELSAFFLEDLLLPSEFD